MLEVYGANFAGVTGWPGFAGAVLHLAGLTLAVAGTALALAAFLRSPRSADLVDSVLAVAVAANLVSYLVSIEPGTVPGTGYDTREIAAVLPLGAVLAGRRLGPRLAKSINANSRGAGQSEPEREASFRSASAVFLGLTFFLGIAGYASALGYGAALPAAAAPDAALAGWLARHGLRDGLGGASANLLTVDSGGRVRVRGGHRNQRSRAPAGLPGGGRGLRPAPSRPGVPGGGRAVGPGGGPRRAPSGGGDPGDVRRTREVYRFAGFTIDVWGVNLLTKMAE